jgi:hypothetical protein
MKNKIIYIILGILIILATIVVLVLFINTNKYNFDNTSYKYVSGDEIPEGTDLNTNIYIEKLYKIGEKDNQTNDFIYKNTVVLIDSSPIRRELDKGITTCWNKKNNELIQVKCPDKLVKKISDKYSINTYESKNVFFKLIYKIK